MADSSLPADPDKPGHVWCDVCAQSLAPARAEAHLVSKKHKEAASAPRTGAPTATPAKRKKDAAQGLPGAPATPAKKSAVSAAKKLLADPDNPDNRWCGICQVSLPARKAEEHLATARHQAREKQTLDAAIRKGRQ